MCRVDGAVGLGYPYFSGMGPEGKGLKMADKIEVIKVELPRHLTVYCAKTDLNYTLDLQETKPAGILYLLNYGATQSVSDKVAGFTVETLKKDAAEMALAKAACESRVLDITKGAVSHGGGGPKLDPVFKLTRDRVAKICKVKKPADLKTLSDIEKVCKQKKVDLSKVTTWAKKRAAEEAALTDFTL